MAVEVAAEATKADLVAVEVATNSGIAIIHVVATVIEEDLVGVAATMETRTLATTEALLGAKKRDHTVAGKIPPILNPSTPETIKAALEVMSLGQVVAAAMGATGVGTA